MTVAELIEKLTDLDKLDSIVFIGEQGTGFGHEIVAVGYERGVTLIEIEPDNDEDDE